MIKKTLLMVSLFLTACQTKTKSTPVEPLATAEKFSFKDLPKIGDTDITLGGFSGLSFAGKDEQGLMTFITHTDRGPNRDMMTLSDGSKVRPFVVPDYSPQWVRFTLLPDHSIKITETTRLALSPKKFISGRPNLAGEFGDETPVDANAAAIALDPQGIDTEGIAADKDGTFWMGEEYRPSILRFNNKGQLVSRWIPAGNSKQFGKPSLPEHFRKRVPNRGFEGVANDGEFVYGFLQGAIKGESGFTRIVKVNKKTGTPVAEYAYVFEKTPEGLPTIDKIGDAVAIGKGRFLVVEQNSGLGEKAVRRIYEIDINPGADLLAANKAEASLSADGFCSREKTKDCINPVSKRLAVDLVEIGLGHLEKAEGIAFIDDATLAIVNDNDFGVGADPNAKSEFHLIHLRTPLKH